VNLLKRWLCILFCVFINLVIGCIGLPTIQKSEPTTIIVRNSSDTYLEEVSIRGSKKQNQYSRMGAISPLPIGISQVIGRGTNPPKLPQKLIICWLDGAKKEICKQVDIKTILKSSQDANRALVFEIFSPSDVRIYLENMQ
jgi:hypothetical protein